jgi:hypothetical protein
VIVKSAAFGLVGFEKGGFPLGQPRQKSMPEPSSSHTRRREGFCPMNCSRVPARRSVPMSHLREGGTLSLPLAISSTRPTWSSDQP